MRRFLMLFGLTSLSLLIVYHFPYPDDSWPRRAFAAYLRTYAWAAGGVLAQLDPEVTVSGLLIHGRFPIEIEASCDAGEMLAVLTAAVLTFPTTWRRRLLGLVAGIPAVCFVNVVRICSLYFVGASSEKAFDLVHHDIWPLLILMLTGLFFLVWARWSQRGSRRESTEPAS